MDDLGVLRENDGKMDLSCEGRRSRGRNGVPPVAVVELGVGWRRANGDSGVVVNVRSRNRSERRRNERECRTIGREGGKDMLVCEV